MLKLNEVSEIIMGQSPSSATYNTVGEGLPFFQGNADFGDEHPNVRMFCTHPIKIAEVNDVLVSVRAPIGAVNVADKKCCVGRGLAAIRPQKGKSITRYLFHLLLANRGSLENKGTGSTFKAITGKVLNSVKVPHENLVEQKEIADILDKIIATIRKRREQVSLCDDLVKSQFIEMFGDPEYNTKKFPVRKLGSLCRVGSSKRIYQDDLTTDGVPFLRISDLNDRIDGKRNFSNIFIPEEVYAKLKNEGLVPVADDILVTARGTLGRCYIVKESDRFYFQDGMITWLSQLSEDITSLYLSYVFETDAIKKQIAGLQAGSTVAYLSIAMTKQLSIICPPVRIQNEFACFVKQTDKSKIPCKMEVAA